MHTTLRAHVAKPVSLLNLARILHESKSYQTLRSTKSVQIRGKARQKHANRVVQVLTNTYVPCLFVVPGLW